MRPVKEATIPLEILRCDAWEHVHWLVQGFSTRTGGSSTAYGGANALTGDLNLGKTPEDAPKNVTANRAALVRALLAAKAERVEVEPELVLLRQTHSDMVYRVGHATKHAVALNAGDGLITNEPGLLLAIQTADCVPVLIVDLEQRAVGAFHAGWRGTVKGILQRGIEQMTREFGSRPAALSAAIGPCIGGCCYGVGEDVRAEFGNVFSYAETLFTRTDTATLKLDLVEANRRQLVDAGLAPRNVNNLRECTACNPGRYFSYRKSGGRTGRMLSVIGIRKRTDEEANGGVSF